MRLLDRNGLTLAQMELNFNFWDWSMKSIVVMEDLSSWLGLAFDFVEEGKCLPVLCNNYMWADEIVELCSCQLPNWLLPFTYGSPS